MHALLWHCTSNIPATHNITWCGYIVLMRHWMQFANPQSALKTFVSLLQSENFLIYGLIRIRIQNFSSFPLVSSFFCRSHNKSRNAGINKVSNECEWKNPNTHTYTIEILGNIFKFIHFTDHRALFSSQLLVSHCVQCTVCGLVFRNKQNQQNRIVKLFCWKAQISPHVGQ